MATITHNRVAGSAANPDVLVDGPAWDEAHVLTGQVGVANGGTGADLSATGGTGQVLKQASAGAAVSVGTVAASEIASGAALTRTNDTNVTLTLGGSPTTSLLAATSVTVGWTGTLAASRGGFGADVSASSGVPLFATGAVTFTSTTGTGNFVRATSPTLVTPALGTPSSGTLTNCTAFTLTTTGTSGAATYSAGTLNIPQYSGGGVTSLNGQTGAVVVAFETKARVTLTSGVAVTESDVSGASSVYVTPAGHNYSLIYDGTNDVPKSYSEITITLDATNALSGKNHDVFLAVSGGNVVAGYGPAWSSDTSRGTGAGTTEIEFYNGRPVNKNSITLRNSSGTTYSIAARQANLVGGFRTTADGLTEDSFAKRFVWNVNSTVRGGRVVESTATWSYSTASYRQVNGSTANQIEYLQGLGGSVVKAYAYSVAFNSTSTVRGCNSGIGIDSTTVNGATLIGFGHVDNYSRPMISVYEGSPGIGYHKLVWLEQGAGTDTQTWYGTSTTVIKTGMTAEFLM